MLPKWVRQPIKEAFTGRFAALHWLALVKVIVGTSVYATMDTWMDMAVVLTLYGLSGGEVITGAIFHIKHPYTRPGSESVGLGDHA